MFEWALHDRLGCGGSWLVYSKHIFARPRCRDLYALPAVRRQHNSRFPALGCRIANNGPGEVPLLRNIQGGLAVPSLESCAAWPTRGKILAALPAGP